MVVLGYLLHVDDHDVARRDATAHRIGSGRVESYRVESTFRARSRELLAPLETPLLAARCEVSGVSVMRRRGDAMIAFSSRREPS